VAYLSNFPGPIWLAVTSRYGYRWGRLHRGTDYGSPNLALYQIFRAPIYAPFSGAFTRGYEDGGAGNWAWVSRQGVLFKAFHLDSYAVDNGAWVEAGDLIGWTGTTGASTGPHDHFELWIGGEAIDPEPHIEAARSTPPLPQPPPEEELDVTAEANLTAKIDASTAQILASLGIPQGTSVKVEIDGVEHDLADNITEAGWSGREYLVGVGHHLPDGTLDTSADDGKVYELRRIDEAPFWAKVHVRGVANPANGEPFRSLLVRAGRNPHVVWIDPDDPAAAELLALPELG
jgi:hypothetical protein